MFSLSPNATPSPLHKDFVLERSAPSPTGEGVVEIYRHQRLEFPILLHRCSDANKFFCAGFLTPHNSADGLPHILEHLVLAGSKEFPLADPFFTTAKGSFKTYLNATTYAEETYYPVASTVERELLNLSRIYLDAVFHPLLTTSGFRREGWRLEHDKDGACVFNGVVFNEMKGAYSDPEGALYYELSKALFADTQRGQSSGGEPACIPRLSPETLRQFHRDHYHPSRAFIVLHGDIGEDGLRRFFQLVEEKVEGFEPRHFLPDLKSHAANPHPRKLDLEFPVDPSSEVGLPFASVGWAIGQVSSPEESLMWDIVERVVIGSSSAPLRREILESGAAAGIVLSGVMQSSLDACFAISAQDVTPDHLEGFEELVIDALTQLVRDGLPKDEVTAALHEIEFSIKRGVGSVEQGLNFALSLLRPWMHGKDPLAHIDEASCLSKVRDVLATNPRCLEELVESRILKNTDRVFIKFKPSHDAFTRAVTEERERVDAYVELIGPDGVKRELELNKAMHEDRGRRDDPALVARIPRLRTSDLPAEIDPFLTVSRTVEKMCGRNVLLQSAKTGGLTYARFAFDLSHLPPHLLAYAPIVASMLADVDTEHHNFIDLDRAVRQKTGGIQARVLISPLANGLDEGAHLIVGGSALHERSEDLLSLMREVSFFSRLTDPKRLRELVREKIAAMELDVIENGSSYATEEVLSALSPMYRSGSLVDGYGQLRFLKTLEKRIGTEWEKVEREIQTFSQTFTIANMTMALCGETHHLDRLAFFGESVLTTSPRHSHAAFLDLWDFASGADRLGLSSSMDVAFIGVAGVLPYEALGLSGKILVAKRGVSYDYLLPEIRQKNGAYGASAFYHGSTCVFGASTYRSKKALIGEDISTCLRTGSYLAGLALSDSDVEKISVGAAAEYAPYEHPGSASGADFTRFLLGSSDDARREVYRQIVSCTAKDMRQVAEFFSEYERAAKVRVLSSAEALRGAGIPVASSAETLARAPWDLGLS